MPPGARSSARARSRVCGGRTSRSGRLRAPAPRTAWPCSPASQSRTGTGPAARATSPASGAGPVGARRLRRAGSPPLPFASQRPKPAPAWAAAWLRLDLNLDPVKTVVHAPAAGHLSVDELRKLLTVKRRLAQSALAPELIEPAPRLHGHGDLHLGSKAPSVPDLGSGRCAYSEVTLKLRVAPTSSMGYRELTSLKTLAPSMSFLKCGSRRYKEAPQRHPCSRSRGLAGPSTEAQHHPAIFVENSLH